MIDPKIAGRVALVTGANNPEGIGAAIARALVAQDVRVFVTGRREGDGEIGRELPNPGGERYRILRARPVGEVVRELTEGGAEVHGEEWDLSVPNGSGKLFDAVENRLGPVSLLINNAAYWSGDTFLPEAVDGRQAVSLVSPEEHDRHFAVNSRAPALLMAEFARRRMDRSADGGRIINISTDGASGHAGAVSYGASKRALESYSRAAAWELGPCGITVNVVAPGPVQSGWISAEMEEKLVPEIPLRRIGEVEDIADVVVFLSSHQARWITGQVLYVGGGHVMPG